MPYDVYFTAVAEDWLMGLSDDDYDSIMARASNCSKNMAQD